VEIHSRYTLRCCSFSLLCKQPLSFSRLLTQTQSLSWCIIVSLFLWYSRLPGEIRQPHAFTGTVRTCSSCIISITVSISHYPSRIPDTTSSLTPSFGTSFRFPAIVCHMDRCPLLSHARDFHLLHKMPALQKEKER
jgi:hypothetical protein